MSSALRGQGHPRGCPHHDETSIVVEAVDQRVEAPEHERVVDGPDGQQVLSVVVMTQPELPEEHEQVHLADTQLDVLSLGIGGPPQESISSPMVVALGVPVDAGLVDPPTEVGRDGHIGGRGDDP